MQRIRPFLFWLFVGAFFAIASGVLFYTFGYRFNFERGIFIYTGSITIKSSPETVDIRIDNTLIPPQRLGILNNSIHIGGLAPGEHFIEVSAPGYLPWVKKTTVQSGLSTEFWNVLLVKEKTDPEKIAGTAFAEKIFPAPTAGLLAVVKKKEGALTVDILDMNADTPENEQIFSLADASLPTESEDNVEWSQDGKTLLIPVEQSGERLYFIVDRATKQATPLPTLAQSTKPLHSPRLDTTTQGLLFYLENTALYRIDIENPLAAPLLVTENVKSYNLAGRNIYYLNSGNGIVYQIPANRNLAQPTQITLTPIALAPGSSYSLVVYDETRLTLREKETGKLWVYNKVDSSEVILRPVAGSGIQGVQFSDDGKKLLFFTDNEISVYFARDWEAQPVRERDSVMQIARFSNTAKNIQWTRDYEHILFTLGDSAKIIELDNRDRRNIADVASVPPSILQVLSRFEEDYIYFVSAPSGDADTVSRIPFSEPSGFFGF